MKAFVSLAALLIAGAAQAQTAPTQTTPSQTTPPGSNLTRDLNSGPPANATYLTPAPPLVPTTPRIAPAPTPPATQPRAAPIGPANPATPPRTAPMTGASAPASPSAAPTLVPRSTEPVATPTTMTPAAVAPRPAATTPSTTAPVTAPAPAATAPATPAPAPAATVLDASARAALPFTVELPPGFELVTGRPGPNFKIYTVRRGEKSFAMIYAGPSSQFPIYSGELVEAGGRASTVALDGQQRHAMEHLFQRQTDPREIHVWTMSLEGADRALAERIAQSVDVR